MKKFLIKKCKVEAIGLYFQNQKGKRSEMKKREAALETLDFNPEASC